MLSRDVVIPTGVMDVLRTLKGAGYEAFLVGGFARDAYLGLQPDDFDVATDARPNDVQRLFARTEPMGVAFGTVLVLHADEAVHVTTYRTEGTYSDGRRPDHVAFGTDIEEDLARRDFTMNAMAWDPLHERWVDPFGGAKDIDARTVRAVGSAAERFQEDALRMLRAVRFSARLGFFIDPDTWDAIALHAKAVTHLSGERVRDELWRMLEADGATDALWMMREAGLLYYVFPELKGAERLLQHKKGAPTLLDHSIQTVGFCPPKASLRFAALWHDIGKLTTRDVTPEGRVTFFGHPQEGAAIVKQVARRLRLSRLDTRYVTDLVHMHMAPHGGVGKKTIRKWVSKYGDVFVGDLLNLAAADAMASGWDREPPEIAPMRQALRHVMEAKEALTVKDLAVNGHDIMTHLSVPPGPEIGRVLRALLDAVLEHPSHNQRVTLLAMAEDFANGAGNQKEILWAESDDENL